MRRGTPTAATPRNVGARALDLEPAAIPEVLGEVDAMPTLPGCGVVWICQAKDAQGCSTPSSGEAGRKMSGWTNIPFLRPHTSRRLRFWPPYRLRWRSHEGCARSDSVPGAHGTASPRTDHLGGVAVERARRTSRSVAASSPACWSSLNLGLPVWESTLSRYKCVYNDS